MIQIKIEGKNCHTDFFSVGIEQAISFLRAWESVENSSESGQFKEGDVVRVVADKNGHGFSVGSKVTLIKNPRYGETQFALAWRALDTNGEFWYLSEDEIEKIN